MSIKACASSNPWGYVTTSEVVKLQRQWIDTRRFRPQLRLTIFGNSESNPQIFNTLKFCPQLRLIIFGIKTIICMFEKWNDTFGNDTGSGSHVAWPMHTLHPSTTQTWSESRTRTPAHKGSHIHSINWIDSIAATLAFIVNTSPHLEQTSYSETIPDHPR